MLYSILEEEQAQKFIAHVHTYAYTYYYQLTILGMIQMYVFVCFV